MNETFENVINDSKVAEITEESLISILKCNAVGIGSRKDQRGCVLPTEG